LSVTRYHALTHDTPGLVDVVCGCIKEALELEQAKDAYQRIASGPLISLPFRQAFSRNVVDLLAGGASADGGWAVCLQRLALRLSSCIDSPTNPEEINGPSKKRRMNDGSSSASPSSSGDLRAAEYGILSRLAVILLDVAVEESSENVILLKPVIESSPVLWRPSFDSMRAESWAKSTIQAGANRLKRSTSRYGLPQTSVTSSLGSVSPEATGIDGERLYQTVSPYGSLQLSSGALISNIFNGTQYLAAFEFAETSGVFDAYAEKALKVLLNTPSPRESWSGIGVEIDDTTLPAALWQNLAIQALPVIE
jgi:hypothetical protein